LRYLQIYFVIRLPDMSKVWLSIDSSIDNSLICDIYCCSEVLFETCVAIKFVDNDDDIEMKIL